MPLHCPRIKRHVLQRVQPQFATFTLGLLTLRNSHSSSCPFYHRSRCLLRCCVTRLTLQRVSSRHRVRRVHLIFALFYMTACDTPTHTHPGPLVVPNASIGKETGQAHGALCQRTNLVLIFWMLASRNSPWYLTALSPSMDEISAGILEASGQSNSSCATGTMFFWSLSANAYSFRTKSVEIGKSCQKNHQKRGRKVKRALPPQVGSFPSRNLSIQPFVQTSTTFLARPIVDQSC
jgi:hypothetical protein